jgi:MurNAc alpha-1-phosphate uridylyltransferase
MKGMILAAGLGTRLKPWTDHHPKAMAPVNGKSLLQRNIEYLQQYGITEVIVNVHHFADQIMSVIEENNGWGSQISISDETDSVLETGGGLRKAGWYFKGEKDFVLMNVDILTNMNLSVLIRQQENTGVLATLAVTDRETSRYFLFDEKGILSGWRNVKTGEEKTARAVQPVFQKAFSGIHVISTGIFPLMTQQGRFSMVDVYLDLARNHTIASYDHTGTTLIDVGKPESIGKAEKFFN